ncbi:uncharacterized protein RCC_05113 [Ramularia collo-cygni]|uniref:DUF6604 domain-containing protein n=1 Tax=Ramularia collo-cygni TaxID=112498 RepID=A0A2D3V3K3_9PEZI|nr:uncharacterized protein RCC_05113 [Ramularia collo-cygni]CZT19267.1 uncharacterized protein RCC_05113 [Ramularia collo-cygni]
MPTDTGWQLYRSYKSGTKHVVSWLANAARQRCNVATFMPVLCEITSSVHAVTLSASDLLTLAKELLAESRPMIPPPTGISDTLVVLASVISLRQESTTWRQQNNSSDHSHHHFIRVLESLALILRQVQANSWKISKQDRPAHLPTACGLNNSFGMLHVELPKKSKAVRPVQEPRSEECDPPQCFDLPCETSVTLENRDDDRDFALCCTLKECHDVRCFIKQVWSTRYNKTDPVSLDVASQITSNAIAMLAVSVDEFTEEYPELGNFDQIAEYAEIALDIDEDGTESFSCGSKVVQFCGSTIDPRDFLCIPAWTLVHLILKVKVSRNMRQCQQVVLHLRTHSTLGGDIFSSLGEFGELYQNGQRRSAAFAGCDAFTQLLIDFLFSDSLLTVIFVFTLQVQLDICKAQEDIVGSTVVELVTRAERTDVLLSGDISTATAITDHSLLGGCMPMSEKQASLFHIIRAGIKSPLQADCGVDISRLVIRTGRSSGGGTTSKWLYNCPTLAGHLKVVLSELEHQDGIDTCNHGLVAHSMAHLYAACQKLSPKLEWPDMDWVITRQGKQGFGLLQTTDLNEPLATGAPSGAIQASAKIFGLSLGVKLSKYTRQRRHGYHVPCVRLPLPSAAACMSRAARLKITSTYMQTREQCVAMVGKLGLPQNTILRATCHRSAQAILSGTKSEKKHKKNCGNESLSTVQVLALLQSSLTSEQIDMHFPFHAFYLYCIVAMDTVVKKCKELKRFRTKMKPGMAFYEIVDELLWEAAEAEAAGRTPTTLLAVTRSLREILDFMGRNLMDVMELQSQLVETEHQLWREVAAKYSERAKVKPVHAMRSKLSLRGSVMEVILLDVEDCKPESRAEE